MSVNGFSNGLGGGFGDIAPPFIQTSDNGGLSDEQIVESAMKKIIKVADNTPMPLREQTRIFSERIRQVMYNSLKFARREERATIYAVLRMNGHEETVNQLRKY